MTREQEMDAPPVAGAERPGEEPGARLAWSVLLGAAAAAVAVRVLLFLASEGSNDIRYWTGFAESIRDRGLLETYRTTSIFNHPPLVGLWAAAAMRLAGRTGLWFPYLFKAVPLAADVLAGWLVWRWWRERGSGRREAMALAVAYLWSPVAILVSAYHGNTDSLLAALLLLAVLLSERGSPLGAGLALAGALNVKIAAMVLFPALLLRQPARRDAVRLSAGFALGVVPFVPVVLLAGGAFFRNAVAYTPIRDHWGIQLFLLQLAELRRGAEVALAASRGYGHAGRWVVALGALAVAALARQRRWRAVDAGAVTMSLFLVFAPGFGLQYCAWPLPLLYASSPRHAHAFSLAAGAFLFLTYLDFWNGGVPALSLFPPDTRYPIGSALFGLLAWIVLVLFIADRLGRPAGGGEASP